VRPDPDGCGSACIRGAIAEWVEAEIQPADFGRRERLLVDVIDPLVHETLDGRIDAWRYFWEPALRFRVHWRQPMQDGNYALLATTLVR
jgi:hypothetical protein